HIGHSPGGVTCSGRAWESHARCAVSEARSCGPSLLQSSGESFEGVAAVNIHRHPDKRPIAHRLAELANHPANRLREHPRALRIFAGADLADQSLGLDLESCLPRLEHSRRVLVAAVCPSLDRANGGHSLVAGDFAKKFASRKPLE